MKPYVVLARKWRSSQFSDLVGQGSVVRTLMNAIQAGRVHHAYLLTGSRGIGKTSIARIFARALRCQNTTWKDGLLYSCGECSDCREIATSTSVDVIEIDGASNNGVDAVREIRENAKFLPASGTRKIYIIDEVHMLTTAAFNALLKTLEEPPEHVIFMMATTEPHKIPSTILSRVQRFDLKRIALPQIQARLEEVLKAEKINADAGVTALVARAAEGSMRDSLSLMDQVIAFSAGKKVTLEAARESIGWVSGAMLLEITAVILERKPLPALATVAKAYEQGHDLKLLTRGIGETLYAAILLLIGAGRSSEVDFTDAEWERLTKAAQSRQLEELELLYQVMLHGIDSVARAGSPKMVLDVLVVKCATAQALVAVGGGAGQGSRAVAPSAKTQGAPASRALSSAATPPAMETRPVEKVTSPASTVQTAPAKNPSWESWLAFIKPKRPALASLLEHGYCEAFPAENQLTMAIAFRPEDTYFREQLSSRATQEQVQELAKEFFGKTIRLMIESREGVESAATKKERERQTREDNARKAAQNHPLISEARSLFGGELGPIELIGGEEGNHANPST